MTNKIAPINKSFYTRYDPILISVIVLVSLLFFITILYRCHFGIDMTDEGYYLHWISNPWIYKFSNSQFGYIYYPLYKLMGENIVLLRQANMVVMLGLSWIVCIKLLRYTFHDDGTSTDYPICYLYGLSFALATCVFSFFGGWWWIPTPSYNSLVLESFLIVMISLLNLSMHKTRVIDWIILGVGGWLTFMAKPTTAVAVGFLSLCYLLILSKQTRPFKISRLFFSIVIACGLTCLSAWLIDGSIYDFIIRLRRGVEMQWLLFNGHAFKFLPKFEFFPNDFTRPILVLFMLLTFFATTARTPTWHKVQTYYLVFLLAISVLICTNYYVIPITPTPWTANLFLAIPLGSWLALSRIPHQKLFDKATLKFTILAILFILLPYACAIGTYEDIWIIMLRMSFFWMLATVPFLALIKQPIFVRRRVIIVLVVSGQLLTISLVQLSMEHPYRQSQSLRTQTKAIDIINIKGRGIAKLIVSDDDAHYIEQLRHVTLNHGFSYGESIIDLSGNYPTALYILGASPIGMPWIPTGFIGSTDVVAAVLSQSSCSESASAWVLTSLNTIDKFNLKILEPNGINQKALKVINEIIDAKNNVKLQLMKPIRSYQESVLACETMHNIQKNARNNVSYILKDTIPTSFNISNLSQTYINHHRLNKAVRLLQNAILINPGNSVFYNNLCFTYALQKKYNDAVLACSEALNIDPDFQLAKNNLLWVKTEMKAIS